MNQSALESPESNAETLRALAGQYIDRHSGVENYVVWPSLEVWLLRRLGLEPLSWLGCLVGGIINFLMVLLPALILTAITGQWASIPLLSWIIVAAIWAGLSMVRNPLFRPAIRNLLSWLWAIVDEADLQRLIAWERKWFSHRVSIPISGALTLGTILPLYFLALHGSDVLAGTAYVGGFVVFFLVQAVYAFVMMAFEASNLSTCKYDLYRLSPADSVVVRRSLRGYNQFGTLAVMIMTVVILLLLILLPGGSGVVAPVVLSLLLVDYVSTAVGTLIPRFLMGRIIRAEKEKEMEILQVRLNDLLPQLEELTEEEYDKMVSLQETQDTIRDSPENLLPLGDLAKVVGALALSTLTIVATALADTYVAEWVKPFLP
jgi:hypothetical protein